jgi:hypothetical protein
VAGESKGGNVSLPIQVRGGVTLTGFIPEGLTHLYGFQPQLPEFMYMSIPTKECIYTQYFY